MIGFVTWPPLLIINVGYNKKGGQVTKPIIVVKIPFKWLAMYFSGIKEF